METITLSRAELEDLVGSIAEEVVRRTDPSGSRGLTRDFLEERPRSLSDKDKVEKPGGRDDRPEIRLLAAVMDHTLLRPEATRGEVERLTDEAREWRIGAVAVNPAWVALAAERLRGAEVRVATVVGFPFGATSTAAKRAEAEAAIRAGAREIDMVMNIGALKSGDLERVENDIRGVVEVCRPARIVLKVILENAYLSDEQKIAACRIAHQSGADFVKTSTGFAPTGATEADVRLMRRAVGPAMGVKAAGGIRTLAAALGLLEAGATRLGLSSSVAVLTEAARILNGAYA